MLCLSFFSLAFGKADTLASIPGDIDYNPVFFSFVLVTENSATLFVNESQVSDDIQKYLKSIQVEVQPYEAISKALETLPKGNKVLINENASLAIAESLGEGNYESIPSLVTAAKAIKNEAEIEGFRQCHVRDGAALVSARNLISLKTLLKKATSEKTAYFAWLEEQLTNDVKISEAQAADKLEEYRSKLDLFKGLSFTTISSTGPNGAIIHYSPDRDECPNIDRNALYLCDSGAQYADGTTCVLPARLVSLSDISLNLLTEMSRGLWYISCNFCIAYVLTRYTALRHSY